jgi:hypothetical protein
VANENTEEIDVEYLILLYKGETVVDRSGVKGAQINSDESRFVISEDLTGCNDATHVQIEPYDTDRTPLRSMSN